jgi:nucleotide-binding universal stress UspA family protein
MKKIIVPTDFSDCAMNALKTASEIAGKNQAELHLVHVYDRPVYGFAEANIDIIKNRKVLNYIEDKLRNIASQDFMKNIKLKKHIIHDKKIWEALGSKKFSEADLIVMGSHGSSGWREYFIGSNTEKVIRYAAPPVLVVKEWRNGFEIKNIVFASNFTSKVDSVFPKIQKLSEMFNSKIHLLKVITPGNFEPTHYSINRMKDFVRKFYLSDYSINIFNDHSVEEGILNFSNSVNADLISMETHGRTGIAHLINGSITEDLVNHISLPVLSIKISYDNRDGFGAPV